MPDFRNRQIIFVQTNRKDSQKFKLRSFFPKKIISLQLQLYNLTSNISFINL